MKKKVKMVVRIATGLWPTGFEFLSIHPLVHSSKKFFEL